MTIHINIDKRTVKQEREYLLSLLNKQERKIKRAYLDYIKRIDDGVTLRRLTAMVTAGDLSEFFKTIDSYIVELAAAVTNAFNEDGKDLVPLIQEKLDFANIAVTFNPASPRAQEIARTSTENFTRQISDSVRNQVNRIVAEGMRTGQGPRDVARQIKLYIGLTDKQEQAVNNYQRLLQENNRQVLQRDLRDRRFDRTVERAVNNDAPLEQRQIDNMVNRYRQRYVTYRAEVIARTESTRALNQANDEAMRQGLQQADIAVDQVERTWRATQDARTRDHHADMRVKVVTGMDTPFIDGLGNQIRYPGDPNAPAETRIQCRCVVTTRIKRPA